jgi:hypothetical protein
VFCRVTFDGKRRDVRASLTVFSEGLVPIFTIPFNNSRSGVKLLHLREREMDALARKFAVTHDPKVRDEIERLAKEYCKLGERGVRGRLRRSSVLPPLRPVSTSQMRLDSLHD